MDQMVELDSSRAVMEGWYRFILYKNNSTSLNWEKLTDDTQSLSHPPPRKRSRDLFHPFTKTGEAGNRGQTRVGHGTLAS